MLKIITVTIPVVLIALLLIALSRPDTFIVQRSIVIQAPTEKIYNFINDFHNWTQWSPYEKLDPTMKKFYSGTESGKGSVYEWKGNNKAGVGRIEIVEAVKYSKLLMNLDLIKPLAGHNTVEFKFETMGNATNVVWIMRGPNAYVTKVMGIFFNLDKMIGKDLDIGLNNLKSIAEKS